MDLGLSGSAALVTGGASGIGAAIAAGLAKEGCDIAIVDRVVDGGVAALQLRIEAAGRRLRAIEADVRDFDAAEQAVKAAKAEFGRLDILVANAGITADAPSWKMTEAKAGCRAFNEGPMGRREVDFIRLRQLLAEGHPWDDELLRAISPQYQAAEGKA